MFFMNKKIIYGVIVVVVLGAVWYSVRGDESVVINTPLDGAVESTSTTTTGQTSKQNTTTKKSVTQKTTVDTKDMYVVTYTKNGFEPSELQVPRGATVKFVNKTNTSMRIFAKDSAKPPFSELNQPKALGLNGEYTFNFVYSGIWEYYNSLTPKDTGNVVVY